MLPGHPENQDRVLPSSQDSQAFQLIPEREQGDERGVQDEEGSVDSSGTSDKFSLKMVGNKTDVYLLIKESLNYHHIEGSSEEILN